MPTIELDERTHEKVVFAAHLMACTPSEVVRRLVESWSTPEKPDDESDGVRVHAVYRGERIQRLFHPDTRTLTVTQGPQAGQSFPSPSAAAMAVIQELNPDRSPNTNGWLFWRVTSSGDELKSLRR
ncbi:hypothetical protein Shyhy01_02750 [Streptomyces hygroscopicus subsp. hygroscopicus]|uniref:hypothetical protein n=1 Tax=Streptomyces sp. KHY 26 TaxID=3097359 RepID=UPI00249FBE93|nr:hypothetical protein [Streptomyces hygroscopicus]GLX47325.1 hypothetical protein Shyhy01_02750 [Streptomyces hygroscopicus subsp. hygroscopicus]